MERHNLVRILGVHGCLGGEQFFGNFDVATARSEMKWSPAVRVNSFDLGAACQ